MTNEENQTEKHTPGPWFEDPTAQPEHMAKCILEGGWIAVEDTAHDGGHVAYCAPANAKIIAASPKLLAALLSLILEFSDYATGSEDENETEAMTHARNLYKEITGIEPMKTWTIIYTEGDDMSWQFWRCQADDSDHAEEQFLNAMPEANLLWINEGTSTIMSLD